MNDRSTALRPEELLLHTAWVRQIAAHLVVDAARADDLAQQTLLTALAQPPKRADHPRAWLASVARSLARKMHRSEERRARHEMEVVPRAPAPSVHEVVEQAQTQRDVVDAVLTLEEPYRTALLLRFFENRPPRALAKELDVPVETVRTRLKRGLELLRAELVQRRGGTAGDAGAWAVSLLGLLDAGLKRAVRRAVLAKAAGAGAGAGVIGVSTVAGVLGVLGMTKLKLAVAALVLAGGTFAVVKVCEPPKLPPRVPVANAARGLPELPAPAIVDSAALTKAAEATRAAESRDPASTKPATAPAADLTGVVEGVVRTSRGEPAAGATVLLEDASSHGDFATLHELCANATRLLKDPIKPHDPRQRAVTQKDGSFRFTDLLSGGAVNVAAVHELEGTALATGVVVVRDAAPTRVELQLAAGVVLRGTVTDNQGVPIAKATLDLNRYEHTANTSSTTTLLTMKCDESGSYRTIALPFRGFRMGASAEGFLHESSGSIEILENERERVVDFRLAKAVTLRGRVLTADGLPAQLARLPPPAGEVAVFASENDPLREATSIDSLIERGRVVREEDRYELTPQWAGMRFVSIWGGDVLLGTAEIGASGAGPDVVVDLARLPKPTPKGVLVVEVVSAADGAAVRQFHADVAADPTTSRDPQANFTTHQLDATNGRVEFDDLYVGRYDLSIRATGFVARFAIAQVTVPTSVTRIELKPALGIVSGRVQDENGRPLSGARVFLLAADGHVASPYPECQTASDAEGRFVFRGVAAGACVVVAEIDGLAADSAAATARETGDATRDDAVLTLRTGVSVTIQPHGRGVEVTGPFMFRIHDEHGAPVIDHHRYPGSITTSSGSGPTFQLAPGPYTVEVFCPKFVTGTAAFTAVAGKIVDVELVPVAEENGGR